MQVGAEAPLLTIPDGIHEPPPVLHGHGEVIAVDLPAPSGLLEGAATAGGAGRGAEGEKSGKDSDVDVGGE